MIEPERQFAPMAMKLAMLLSAGSWKMPIACW
jgi:hypothetical protein